MTELKLDQLTFEYDGHCLFDHFDFHLPAGQFSLLTGPSGCGKSTLLKLLAGLLPQYGGDITGGQALLNGQNVGEIVPYQRAPKVAMLFQHPGRQLAMKTVNEQVRFVLANLQVPVNTIEQRTADVLRWLGIEKFSNRQVQTLSGGEQQKVALACVLAMDSDIILLDEPFANVDITSRQEILTFLKRLQEEQGKTILLADHDLSGYRGIADRWFQLGIDHQLTVVDPKLLPATPTLTPVKRRPLHPARLQAQDLTIQVGDRTLIKESHLRIPQGQLGLLSGDNGVGKSTLFATISRQRDFCGTFSFDNRPANKLALKKWALTVGWVFQNSTDQFIAVKAADELQASLTASLHPEYWTKQRLDAALKQLGIADCLDRVSYQLSGGQQKKLQLLSMLVMAHPVMLLDEPFAGLDQDSLRATIQLLRQVATDLNIGMLIISHQRVGVVDQLDYEVRLADQTLTLLGGDDHD